MDGPKYHFEWDDEKAHRNLLKHDVSFELAATLFHDPHLLTLADVAHSESEDRWFSIGCDANGSFLSVVYLWVELDASVKIRLISARKATRTEISYYQEGTNA